MKKALIHAVCYLLVSAISFYAGVLTRDYLVDKKRAEARERPMRFLGKSAPEVRSQDINGNPWSLADQRGKVIVLDFWATWCGPCIAALPELKAIHAEFSSYPDFALLGIPLDAKEEVVHGFCTKNSLNWTQLFEPGKEIDNSIAKAFEIRRIPVVCIIDKKGIVRYYDHTTRNGDPGNLQASIKKLLNE